MTPDILNYLEEFGGLSFKERPFGDVDSLVLCQLGYLKFDGIVPGVLQGGAVSLRAVEESALFHRLFSDVRFEKNNRELYSKVSLSRRFAGLQLACYENILDPVGQSQFSAITFLPEDGPVYVAFRGTDETFLGWKEDLDMCYLEAIPAQKLSVEYLERVVGSLDQPILVGGHSKGGNLAVYSAMKCKREIQNRILKIYSLDGPGFPEIGQVQKEYDVIKDKIVKILPYSSIIGMLFETQKTVKVVDSSGWGIMQHDAFCWHVKDGEFVKKASLLPSRQRKNELLNRWVASLTREQKHVFADTLYKLFQGSKTDNLIDFSADIKKSMIGMIESFGSVDKDTKKILGRVIKSLFEMAGNRVRENTFGRFEKWVRDT